MSLPSPIPELPTLPRLGISPSAIASISPPSIASEWFTTFSQTLQDKSSLSSAIPALFHPTAWWRDMLALTWDFRTFHTLPLISTFLTDRIATGTVTLANMQIKEGTAGLQQLYPDLAWVWFEFEFLVEGVGKGEGIIRLIPIPGNANANAIEWKAHTIYTTLVSLSAFPPLTHSLRNHKPNHGSWASLRTAEAQFNNTSPCVLVIGAGQSGLEVAARLKYMGIDNNGGVLCVERNERVGDNWRLRYEALCLHDPVWYDHMPYLPFPPTWPVYTPALKLADWLESYANSLELNVWTSSTVTSAVQNSTTHKWDVTIVRKRRRSSGLAGLGEAGDQGAINEEEERKFTVNHVIFATGLGSGVPNTPKIAGMDKFKGIVLHSSQHRRAEDHKGKKVVVVGACTSAHDIAEDYYYHGVDVTMFQRGSSYIMSCKNGWKVLMEGIYSENAPPSDLADKINASFPHFMSIEMKQREVEIIAEMDKDILDGLHKVGFRTNKGIEGTGFGLLAWSKAGGYYLDTGASQLIADKKIKLKNDAQISKFTETGIKFDNGSELEADVVVFATGLGDPREQIRRVCGDAVAGKCKPIWGLNEEGELNGVWRDLGVPGLWYMMGNLALCRFHSNHVALQIKAMEEGIFGTRYSAQ